MRRKNWWSFIKGILLIQLFLLAIIAGLTVNFNNSFKALAQISPNSLLQPFSVLPISKTQAEGFFKESNTFLAGGSVLASSLGAADFNPQNLAEGMIDSQIQVLAYTDLEEDNPEDPARLEGEDASEQGLSDNVSVEAIDAEIFKGHKIFIYCTHSAESYIPDSGKARLDGKRGLINSVASKMEQDLQNAGLQAHFIDTIHDYPDYNASYANSRTTMKKIVQSNDAVLAIFDAHRDSIPGTSKAETIEIKGKKSARILIVTGSDERKPHPDWKKNYDFAQRLVKQSDSMYPGLVKGIRVKAGTYNQEFHPRALLLEFGSDYNTLEEASYAANLFTEVIVRVLKEDFQQQ